MISIVVVTYNRLDYTKQCLESIVIGTDVPMELIVVDNASTDGSREWLDVFVNNLRTHGFPAQFIPQFENVGCAEGYNIGFRAATGDPIFRVDNDVILPHGWASAFLTYWDTDPKLGMLTTDLETEPRAHPENVRVSPKLGISYFRDVWHDHGIGSWCMAHRRAMFEEIGYYRTDFGLIVMNDTDLELRAERAGWKIGTLSGLVVGHLWRMESEDERTYNHWKITQQADYVETWNKLWRDEHC